MNLKGILILVSHVVFSLVASSQVTTTSNTFTTNGNDQDSLEIVTVGSIMPYKVSPFNWGCLQEFMNPSIFKWWLNGNANGYELLKADGKTPLTPLPPPNHVYFPDSSITIHWIKAGKYRIRVNEKTIPKTKINICDNSADLQTLSVLVTDRPSVSWNGSTSISGCNLGNTAQLAPLMVNGSGQVTVTYTLVYTDENGTTKTQTGLKANINMPKDETSFQASIPVNIPTGGFGIYEITITEVNDKISAKCGVHSQLGDIPKDIFTITASSDLETGPIQFVKELK